MALSDTHPDKLKGKGTATGPFSAPSDFYTQRGDGEVKWGWLFNIHAGEGTVSGMLPSSP